MKKFIFTLVAMMAVTAGFAKNSNDKRFDMSCDIDRLSVTLGLDEDQQDAVEEIQDSFSDEMQQVAELKGWQQRHGIHMAVRKDAQQMRKVLNREQFQQYMRILMVTLRNRNL